MASSVPKALSPEDLARALAASGAAAYSPEEMEVEAGLRPAPLPPIKDILSPMLPPGEVPDAFDVGPAPVTEREILGNLAREGRGKGLDNQVYGPDGGELDGAEAARAVADGTARFRQDARVTMVNADGERRTVPAAEVGLAMSDFGFRPESKEERVLGDARAYVREHPGQSFTEGLASGFSFGLSDLEKGGTSEYDRALREESPWLYGAGVIGGAVGNPLTWVGGGGGAVAGEAAAARVAARGLLSEGTALGRAGLAATRIGTAGGLEGAAFEAGRELSRAGLADDDVTVERMLLAAGRGGGLGLLTGGVLGGTGSLTVSAAKGAVPKIGEVVGGALAKRHGSASVAEDRVRKALGTRDLPSETVAEVLRRPDLLPIAASKAGRAKNVLKKMGELEADAASAASSLDRAGHRFDARDVLEAAGERLRAQRDMDIVSGIIRRRNVREAAKISGAAEVSPSAISPGAAAVIEEKFMPVLRGADDFTTVQKVVNDIRKASIPLAAREAEAFQKFADAVEGGMVTSMGRASPEASAAYVAARDGAKALAFGRQALETSARESTVLRGVHQDVTDVILSGLSPMLIASKVGRLATRESGALEAGLLALGRKDIGGRLSEGLQKVAKGIDDVAPEVAASVLGSLAKGSSRAAEAAQSRTASVLPSSVADYLSSSEIPRLLIAHPERLQALLQDRTKLLSMASPPLAQRASAAMVADYEWLTRRMPKAGIVEPTAPPGTPAPVSPMAAEEYNRGARALDDPLGQLARLRDGELSPEVVAVLSERRPALLAQVRAEMANTLGAMAEQGLEPTYKSQIQMSLVTGVALTPTMDPGYIAMSRDFWAKKRAKQEAAASGGGPPPPQTGPQVRRRAKAEMAASEQLESGEFE